MNKSSLIAVLGSVALGLASERSGSFDRWIKRKGKLGGKGFLTKPRVEQEELLSESVDKYGYRSTLGSIMVLERSTVLEEKYGRKLERLRNWLRETYGGEGSYAE